MSSTISRRRLLRTAGHAFIAAGVGVCGGPALEAKSSSKSSAKGVDYYQKLGVTPLINAAGTYTVLSASTMPDEVLKNEVIIQKAHRYGYDHALRNCGIRFVEVETIEQYEQAFTDHTVMTHFFNAGEGQISREDWVRVALQHGVPCFNDAAADVPPIHVPFLSVQFILRQADLTE
jgi:hypothetical protein